MHWGSEEDMLVGSEHTINDKRYSLELHLVHYKGYAFGAVCTAAYMRVRSCHLFFFFFLSYTLSSPIFLSAFFFSLGMFVSPSSLLSSLSLLFFPISLPTSSYSSGATVDFFSLSFLLSLLFFSLSV